MECGGLIIAGTHSSAGKTTISLGLMAALTARSLSVQPYKVGPDFIDPGHHTVITGRPSLNLDGWMMNRSGNETEYAWGQLDHPEVCLVEGVMGLFDGLSGTSEAGSTAQMAKWLGLPVILVIDARSMARSAAALLKGFETFDPGLNLAGVIFNRVGSANHLDYLKTAVESTSNVRVLGGLGRYDDLAIPERHLGLMTAQEQALPQNSIIRLAQVIEQDLDVDAILELAHLSPAKMSRDEIPSPTLRLAVASDEAFCFYYEANIRRLRGAGATIEFFSPLAGEIPTQADLVYLGGGYPELFADRLARQHELKTWLRQKADQGLPIYAECGGFMFLGRSMTDLKGIRHEMAGVLPHETTMNTHRAALGYREVELVFDCILGPAGTIFRGHEFHYSTLNGPVDAPTVYTMTPGRGGDSKSEGYSINNVVGSYFHAYFGSNPDVACNLVKAGMAYKEAGHAAG